MQKQTLFNQGDKGNVCIGSDGRQAKFADQTLFASSHPDIHVTSMASVHISEGKVYFTQDGSPYYGGATVMTDKAAAVTEAEARGFVFAEEAKSEFLASNAK